MMNTFLQEPSAKCTLLFSAKIQIKEQFTKELIANARPLRLNVVKGV